ncbi:MAG TPA: DUF4383 domain-containing protein [Verrucomicrobiae bacterium]|nr:DUF4383 domain-containing protein [Verrucomicrobiae bacterium]
MNATIFTRILGLTFILVGIAGTVTGTHAHNLVIFGINMPHNLVHVISGVFAVFASGLGPRASRTFCRIFGVVYGLVTIAGFARIAPVVSYLNINAADNWLHLAISVSCLIAGFGNRKHRRKEHRPYREEALAA